MHSIHNDTILLLKRKRILEYPLLAVEDSRVEQLMSSNP